MVPFLVLILSFAAFRAAGLIVPYLNDWQTSLQFALAAMFLVAASAHWGKRRPDLIRMVPAGLPRPDVIVTVTGWLEIILAIGLLLPGFSEASAIGLTLLMMAMFPANIRAAREGIAIGGQKTPPLWLRSILQLIFIAAALAAGGVLPA